MSHLIVDIKCLYALEVRATGDALNVDLIDGRAISAPLGCFHHTNHEERVARIDVF